MAILPAIVKVSSCYFIFFPNQTKIYLKSETVTIMFKASICTVSTSVLLT